MIHPLALAREFDPKATADRIGWFYDGRAWCLEIGNNTRAKDYQCISFGEPGQGALDYVHAGITRMDAEDALEAALDALYADPEGTAAEEAYYAANPDQRPVRDELAERDAGLSRKLAGAVDALVAARDALPMVAK